MAGIGTEGAPVVGRRRYSLSTPLWLDELGTVWRGVTVPDGRPVIVRIVSGQLTRDSAFVVRLHRELLKATRARSLPGIARVIDHGDADTRPYFIVMEAVEGERLADRLTRGERWSVSAADQVVDGVADRLAAARRVGLHHGRVRAGSIVFGVSSRATARSSDVVLLDLAVEAALPLPTRSRLGARLLRPIRRRSPLWVAVSRDLNRLRRTMVAGPNAHLLGAVRGGVMRFGAEGRTLWRAMRGGLPRADPIAWAKPQRGRAHPTPGTEISTPGLDPIASANATERRRTRPKLIVLTAAAVTAVALAAGVSGLDQSVVPKEPIGAHQASPAVTHRSDGTASNGPSSEPHGTTRIRVPSVLGVRVLQAWRLLGRADLAVASVAPTEGALGRVVATVPAPNEVVARGTGVTLYVGTTPARVEGAVTGARLFAHSTG
jgi:hypothetical protein